MVELPLLGRLSLLEVLVSVLASSWLFEHFIGCRRGSEAVFCGYRQAGVLLKVLVEESFVASEAVQGYVTNDLPRFFGSENND